jgi:hypothetical protein
LREGVDQISVGVEGGLGGVVVGHDSEVAHESGVVGAGVAQRVVDVAGEIEGFGIAGDDLDDGGQDLGLTFLSRTSYPSPTEPP